MYNCIISDEELDIDEQFIAKQITRDDMLGAADQMMDSFATVIWFINVFSVVVYLVIMYIMTKLVIDKNALSKPDYRRRIQYGVSRAHRPLTGLSAGQ